MISDELKAVILALPMADDFELEPGHTIRDVGKFKMGLIRDFDRGRAQKEAAFIRLEKVMRALR
jgi:hypothetical protein